MSSTAAVSSKHHTFSDKNKSELLELKGHKRKIVSTSIFWGTALVNCDPILRAIYSWKFLVSCKVDGSFAFGVVSESFDAKGGDVPGCDGSWVITNSGMAKASDDDGWSQYCPEIQPGAEVRMNLDMITGTLSFHVNGESMGVAFLNLSRHSLVPAVCIGGTTDQVDAKIIGI